MRGYVITADSSFLEPYGDGLANESARLRRRCGHNEHAIGPAVAAELATVRASRTAWQREYVGAGAGVARESPRGASIAPDARASVCSTRAGRRWVACRQRLKRKDAQARDKLDSAATTLQTAADPGRRR